MKPQAFRDFVVLCLSLQNLVLINGIFSIMLTRRMRHGIIEADNCRKAIGK